MKISAHKLYKDHLDEQGIEEIHPETDSMLKATYFIAFRDMINLIINEIEEKDQEETLNSLLLEMAEWFDKDEAEYMRNHSPHIN